MDFKTARAAMVESQIRPNGVRDAKILAAFAAIPREFFVSGSGMTLAYRDEIVPVDDETSGSKTRYLLAPMTLAKLISAANIGAASKVLDVGGVCGYSAAILRSLGAAVFALENFESLAVKARENLLKTGIEGVSCVVGPLPDGFAANQPYDVILLNGSVTGEPQKLFGQLAEGGRLVAILSEGWQGHAYIYTKTGGAISGRAIFDASAPVLPGFEAAQQFVF